MATIGTRLKTLRGKQSLEIFSNNFGIHRVTLSRFEKDERVPDADFLKAVIEQTGICSEWIIMGTGPMFKDECPPCRTFFDEKNMQQAENIKQQTSKNVAVSDTNAYAVGPKTASDLDHDQGVLVANDTQLSDLKRSTPLRNLDHDQDSSHRDLLPRLLDQYAENASLIRANADLRVELERQKAQIRDLERENEVLAKEAQELRQAAMEITDMAVVRLAQENKELRGQVARLNRFSVFDEPDTRMPQAEVPNRK